MADISENVIAFVEMTAAEPPLARKYLLLADGNVANAVSLYFDMGGADLPDDTIPAASVSSSSSMSAALAGSLGPAIPDDLGEFTTPFSSAPIMGANRRPERVPASSHGFFSAGNDDDMEVDSDDAIDYEEISDIEDDMAAVVGSSGAGTDAALGRAAFAAARTQPPAYSGGSRSGGGGDGSAGGSAGRAYARMVAGRGGRAAGARGGSEPSWAPSASGAAAAAAAASTSSGNFNPFAQSDTSAVNVPSNLSERESRLAELFRPPTEILFKGTFENARTQAKMDERWLLVDLNDSENFACQCLNRDLWKHKRIAELIRDHFVFVQVPRHSAEGNAFFVSYRVQSSPHVSIIDPLVGEQFKVFSPRDLESPERFVDKLADFLADYSFGAGSAPGMAASSASSLPSATAAAVISGGTGHLTEEEQLELALQASLETSTRPKPSVVPAKAAAVVVLSDSDNDDDMSMSDADSYHEDSNAAELNDDTGSAGGQAVAEPEPTPHMKVAYATPLSDPEPAAGAPNTTRVQVRFPDGARAVRRIALNAPVLDLFRFVKATRDEVAGVGLQAVPFTLQFNRQNLIEWLDRSVAECGLGNSSLIMALE
ncbi:hypothetical protein BC828DRAFT_395693 [Blastocladiella britannica]|nr:hypothetical protein BC828DRAFT_395693 [Blastocladiella britannica]